MSNIITHPTYAEIHKACIELRYNSYLNQVDRPKYVVGLQRGGLIPAVIISHALNDMSMRVIDYSSEQGAGDDAKQHENTLPSFEHGASLLIVDDICDTGHTMKEVVEFYERCGHPVTTFCLYYKEGAVFKPDYIWQTIPEDAPWIIFPFENVTHDE